MAPQPLQCCSAQVLLHRPADILATAQILLRPRCCLVVSGDTAYRRYQHSIRDQATDTVTDNCRNLEAAHASVGDVVGRSERRLSLVFVTKLGGTGPRLAT